MARPRCAATPTAIRLNYGMQRVRGGGNAVRAIACLPALVGAWRQRAGGVLLSASGNFPVQRAALERPDLRTGKPPRTINMNTIGDDLLRPASAAFGPAIEALIVYNSNPVAVAPDSSKVVRGFAREDLFTVVLEHFKTDTADYADYLLPATTQLEHWDVQVAYGHTDVLLNRPAIAPVGRGQAEQRRYSANSHGTWASPSRVFPRVTKACAASRTAMRSISRSCWPRASPRCGCRMRRLQKGRFPTPSGKCEFFSARLAALGAWTDCRTICPTTKLPAARRNSRWP